MPAAAITPGLAPAVTRGLAPAVAAAAAPVAAASPAAQAAGIPAAPPSRWSPAVLAGIEHELARWVGPVAKVLVYRAAQRESDLGPLVAALLPSIDRAEDRDAFSCAVMRARPTAVAAAPAAAAPRTAAPRFQPSRDELDRITRLLRGHVGPLAGVVVQRAAAAGTGREDFLREVARVFDTEAQREQFLSAAQR